MNERRHYARHRTLKAGKIEFNRRLNLLDCVIRNMSKTGALLQVDQVEWLPERFDLRIPIDGVTVHCRLVWKAGDRIGVAFIEENGGRHDQAA